MGRRKVLVIEDESSIRNVIYVLLGALKCDGEGAYYGQQALAMVQRESFDAVLLDLRSSELSPREVVSGIRELRPSLMGRILFITSEVTDPEIIEMIGRNKLTCVQRGDLLHNLWERLRLVFNRTESASGWR